MLKSLSAISVSHLGVTYSNRGERLVALEDVSFQIPAQEFVCVLGPSGCGKTTLLRALAGILEPTKGKVIFDPHLGQPRVGLIFQHANLMPWRTVLQNITLPLQLQGISTSLAEKQARKWIHQVGLKGFEHAWPRDLSSGMAQRVALARAFLQNPDILLLDEPFGALDALTRERMGGELLRIWQGERKTVVMVTHSIAEALLLSDRVILLSQRPGRLVLDMKVPLERPRKEEIRYAPQFGKIARKLRSAILPASE
jgi:NitT/TauT family transport system ATP-binding protein